MLDLQPGVHLQEEELVAGDQELHRAGVDVADLAGQRDRCVAQPPAQVDGHRRRRGLLQHLLVTTLHRAVALVQVQHGAVRVRDDLHLDVPAVLDEALQQQCVVAEGARRLPPGRVHAAARSAGVADDPHALAAAAGCRLHQHRVRHRPSRAVTVSQCLPPADGDNS